ncbi:metalloregulator ArsR/SmtB family transcription factor [Alkalihalobacillus sp. LMS39]|uniref:ArsR/SmtB family transcription factor n=1 Tax=Alkalihalobacillus sp. LMS39 TaxID=2924032 RepID=UPI001FB49642|nr:metalloregulator ArsR/SmtB family transcription factor [Alkalihalobacillus sp. LMS39]UOE94320.1 metalloregulator ArsR/SmtB family transcription factor [Alkalihalobacillus sp. LMS39]
MTVQMETATKVLKLLGDKTRLTMMSLLMEDECCVCEFVSLFDMSQPSVSQHLRKLRDIGLVLEERRGQWIFYRANANHEAYELMVSLLKHLPSQKEKLHDLEQKGLRVCCE